MTCNGLKASSEILSIYSYIINMYIILSISDCSMFELGQLVNWSLNLSRAYDISMQFSAADCIGNCLDATTCNGAVYDVSTYECYRFASCGSTCLVASAVSDSYRLYCRQGNVGVNQHCGFRTGPTQTGLYKHRRWLEAGNFGFRKKRNYTIRESKTKALISFAVTAKLICAFVYAYGKCLFSHDAVNICLNAYIPFY